MGYIGIFRDIREYLRIYGNIWGYTGIFGDIWESMGINGNIWEHLKYSNFLGYCQVGSNKSTRQIGGMSSMNKSFCKLHPLQ